MPLIVLPKSCSCLRPRVPSRRTNAALTTHQHSVLVTTIRPQSALSAGRGTGNGRDADGPEEERPALLRTLGMRVCETHSHRTHAGGLQRAAQCAR